MRFRIVKNYQSLSIDQNVKKVRIAIVDKETIECIDL